MVYTLYITFLFLMFFKMNKIYFSLKKKKKDNLKNMLTSGTY